MADSRLRQYGLSSAVDGRTSVPGLYFVGVHGVRKNKSAILNGIGEDARLVAEQVIAGLQ